ncbi:MAG: DNA translocase FtsK, partial [bacterium]
TLPVHLGEIVRTMGFQKSSSKLNFVVGKDISGDPVFADMNQMPHLLIAGTTGSGKSVCVNSIIISLLMRATPDEVKFLMIDPKMVELSGYDGIPHLISPVITDSKIAASTLKHWATKEMDRRYREFFAAGVRNIDAYNMKVGRFIGKEEKSFHKNKDADEDFVPQKMPYIVIIIDELADPMMIAPADVETTICRIAQMARATGMHLMIATQRPSVDVITGLIKANIPSRISFAVATQIDSRVILDMAGAEKLLGKGDMLWNPIGAMKPTRMQGAFVSDAEIERIIGHVKMQRPPEYYEEVLDIKKELSDSPTGEGMEKDELFAEAARIVVDSGQSSTSHLQRRMRIGYNRAARLMDELQEAGIVSAAEGDNKPRRIIASRQTLLEQGLIAGQDFEPEPANSQE